jgi:hypothetical protein
MPIPALTYYSEVHLFLQFQPFSIIFVFIPVLESTLAAAFIGNLLHEHATSHIQHLWDPCGQAQRLGQLGLLQFKGAALNLVCLLNQEEDKNACMISCNRSCLSHIKQLNA